VIGILAVEMAGAVYCPLSPRDPQHRLHALLEQTRCRLVLVHAMTLDKLNGTDHSASTVVDIECMLSCLDPCTLLVDKADLERLSSVLVEPDSTSYVIFTSGSTGTPKAVSFYRHSICLTTIAVCSYLGSSATSKLCRVHTISA
jgi:non-ribosomal peptide synthetase component F